MATHTITAGDVAKHGIVLAAGVVDTVTVDANTDGVVILSDGLAALYFTVDGSTPTVAGANTYPMPAAVSSFEVSDRHGFTGTLKVISAGTPTLSVYRL